MMRMQYKSFIWPNNPGTYTLSCERQTAVQKIPMGGFVVQDLGKTCMVMRGEGEFFGPQALDHFQSLVRVFMQDGAGMLVHPAWHGGAAFFTNLQLTQEPREDYVSYRFEFCQNVAEENEQQTALQPVRSSTPRYHTVREGENLWQICGAYGLSMRTLLGYNPGLYDPVGLTVGQKVRVQ